MNCAECMGVATVTVVGPDCERLLCDRCAEQAGLQTRVELVPVAEWVSSPVVHVAGRRINAVQRCRDCHEPLAEPGQGRFDEGTRVVQSGRELADLRLYQVTRSPFGDAPRCK